MGVSRPRRGGGDSAVRVAPSGGLTSKALERLNNEQSHVLDRHHGPHGMWRSKVADELAMKSVKSPEHVRLAPPEAIEREPATPDRESPSPNSPRGSSTRSRSATAWCRGGGRWVQWTGGGARSRSPRPGSEVLMEAVLSAAAELTGTGQRLDFDDDIDAPPSPPPSPPPQSKSSRIVSHPVRPYTTPVRPSPYRAPNSPVAKKRSSPQPEPATQPPRLTPPRARPSQPEALVTIDIEAPTPTITPPPSPPVLPPRFASRIRSQTEPPADEMGYSAGLRLRRVNSAPMPKVGMSREVREAVKSATLVAASLERRAPRKKRPEHQWLKQLLKRRQTLPANRNQVMHDAPRRRTLPAAVSQPSPPVSEPSRPLPREGIDEPQKLFLDLADLMTTIEQYERGDPVAQIEAVLGKAPETTPGSMHLTPTSPQQPSKSSLKHQGDDNAQRSKNLRAIISPREEVEDGDAKSGSSSDRLAASFIRQSTDKANSSWIRIPDTLDTPSTEQAEPRRVPPSKQAKKSPTGLKSPLGLVSPVSLTNQASFITAFRRPSVWTDESSSTNTTSSSSPAPVAVPTTSFFKKPPPRTKVKGQASPGKKGQPAKGRPPSPSSSGDSSSSSSSSSSSPPRPIATAQEGVPPTKRRMSAAPPAPPQTGSRRSSAGTSAPSPSPVEPGRRRASLPNPKPESAGDQASPGSVGSKSFYTRGQRKSVVSTSSSSSSSSSPPSSPHQPKPLSTKPSYFR
eukprot:Sspe_Gene.11828::Locus_4015_Transcript_1_3_Confidence_0.500_Length_2623::g.11828::m.11828